MDWISFFHSYSIPYVTSGPNTPKGSASIKCPWCGHEDPSEHLNISLDDRGYHCWRNREHKGRSPTKLIQILLGCSYEQARSIAGLSYTIPEDFFGQVQMQFAKPLSPDRKPIKLPAEFKPLKEAPSCRLFNRYLKSRGYPNPIELSREFDLRYCTTGPYKGRIIFPVYYQQQLVTWTGRTVYPSETFRYKTLTTKKERAELEGTPVAVGSIYHYLLFYDDLLQGGDAICLCEGPFDALRVNYLGKSHLIRATCFFTNSPSDQQIELLHELLPRYENKYLLLDQGTLPIALKVLDRLTGLDVNLLQLPHNYKDPALLPNSRALLELFP